MPVSDSASNLHDLDPLNLEVPPVGPTVEQVLREPRHPQTQVRSCCNICIPICVLGASLALLLLGFNIAVMTEAMEKKISKDLLEYQTLVLYLLSLVGTILAGLATDRWGRLKPIMLTGLIFGFGSLLMGALQNNAGLVVGRCIIQIAAGFGTTATTLYVSEVSPPSWRGFLTSMPEVFLNLGTLLGFYFHYVYSKLHPEYRRPVVLTSAVVWPVMLVIGYRILPESPRWLVMQGQLGDALRVLEERICSSRREARLQLEQMKESVGIPPERTEMFVIVALHSWQSLWRDLHYPSSRLFHIMICTWVIQAFQQLCGIETIFIYRSRFFDKIALTSANEMQLMTIRLQFVKTAVMLFTTFLMDIVGRRNMLMGSLAGTAVSLASLGIGVFGVYDDKHKPKWAKNTITASLYLCLAAYSAGMGSIPSVYAAEVFPIRLRSSGYVISVAMNQAVGAVISAGFVGLELGGAVLMMMVLSMMGCVFVYFCMPDTHRRTLERTHTAFGSARAWRNLQTETEVEMEAVVEAPAPVAGS